MTREPTTHHSGHKKGCKFSGRVISREKFPCCLTIRSGVHSLEWADGLYSNPLEWSTVFTSKDWSGSTVFTPILWSGSTLTLILWSGRPSLLQRIGAGRPLLHQSFGVDRYYKRWVREEERRRVGEEEELGRRRSWRGGGVGGLGRRSWRGGELEGWRGGEEARFKLPKSTQSPKVSSTNHGTLSVFIEWCVITCKGGSGGSARPKRVFVAHRTRRGPR